MRKFQTLITKTYTWQPCLEAEDEEDFRLKLEHLMELGCLDLDRAYNCGYDIECIDIEEVAEDSEICDYGFKEEKY